jgi:predicted acylesterase/phospholipase RssA
LGADLVIACDVNYNADLQRLHPTNFFSMLMKLMFLTAFKNCQEAKAQADVTISMDAHGIGVTALGQASELIARGRQATAACLPALCAKIQSREA